VHDGWSRGRDSWGVLLLTERSQCQRGRLSAAAIVRQRETSLDFVSNFLVAACPLRRTIRSRSGAVCGMSFAPLVRQVWAISGLAVGVQRLYRHPDLELNKGGPV
jgi:hypothetical protein